MQDNTPIREPQREPLRDLYDEYNPSLKLAKTYDEFKSVMQDPKARQDFFKEFNPNLQLANTYKEFEEVLSMKPKQAVVAETVPIPSFREFAAKSGMPIHQQRQAAEGTLGPDLQLKAQQQIDVIQAPERKRHMKELAEKKKNEALENTTKRYLDSQKIKYEVGDPLFKKTLEDTRRKADDGVLALTVLPGTKTPIYDRALGPIESLAEAFKNSYDELATAVEFKTADNREKQRLAEIESKKELKGVPTGMLSKVTSFLGYVAKPVAEARIGAALGTEFLPGWGTAAGGIGSFLLMLPDAFAVSSTTETIKRYNEEIGEIKRKYQRDATQEEKDIAMSRAVDMGNIAGTAESAVIAGLSTITGGNSGAAKNLLGAVKQWSKHAAYDVTKQVALGAVSETAKGVAGATMGYNDNAASTLSNIIERGGNDAAMAMSFSLYHVAERIPKYVTSAAKNYLSSMPRPELNNLSRELEGRGMIPEGSTVKMNADLDRFQEAKKSVPNTIPVEDMGSFAGLLEAKKSIEEQKKLADPIFHPQFDERISAINERLDKMQRSKNPIEDEVDDVTGATGVAIPHTESSVSESLKILYPEIRERVTKEELTPTIKVGDKEYTGADHGEAMMKAIDAGEKIPNPNTDEGKIWREQNGLFKEKETGKLLTRDESQEKYGIKSSSELEPVKEIVSEKIVFPEVSEQEYKQFTDNNIVSEERLNIIANKLVVGEQLSAEEQSMYGKKSDEISTKTSEILKPIDEIKWRDEFNKSDVYRKGSILRSITEVSSNPKEISDILTESKGLPEESNIVMDVIRKPINQKENIKTILEGDYSELTKDNVRRFIENKPELKPAEVIKTPEQIDIDAHLSALDETIKGTEYEQQARSLGLREKPAERPTGEVPSELKPKAAEGPTDFHERTEFDIWRDERYPTDADLNTAFEREGYKGRKGIRPETVDEFLTRKFCAGG